MLLLLIDSLFYHMMIGVRSESFERTYTKSYALPASKLYAQVVYIKCTHRTLPMQIFCV